MSFSLSDYVQNKKSSGERYKTTTESTGDKKNVTSAAIKNLVPGQTITGEVVSVKDGEVQIEIDKDAYITAKLERNLAIALGQTLTFEVSGNSASQIILRPLFANLSQDPNLQKALESANIPITKDTMSLVSKMMEGGLSVDKQTLQGMYRDMVNNKTALPEDLVLLKKLSLPVNEENLKLVANYRTNSHQLVQGVLDVLDELPKTVQNFFQAGNMKDGITIYQAMFTLLQENAGDVTGREANLDGRVPDLSRRPMDSAGLQTTTGNLTLDASASKTDSSKIQMDPSKMQGDTTKILSDLLKMQGGNVVNPGNTASVTGEVFANQNVNLDEMVDGKVVLKNKGEVFLSDENSSGQISAGTKGQTLNLGIVLNEFVKTSTISGEVISGDIKEVLSRNEMKNLEQLLMKTGVSGEVVDAIKNQPQSINQFITAMKDLLQQGQEWNTPELKELLLSKECNKLLQNEILKQWFMEPEDVGKQGEVKDLYERIHRQTQVLSNAMNEIGKENNSFDKGVQQLRGNLEFMNQINQFYSYVQIPLKMGRQNANGELYVYTDKKSLAQHEGNVSALLHLEMDQLGTMDVYVAMQQDKVNTKFYLPDEDTILFLEKHIHLLDERLKMRGYDSSAEFLKREKEVSVVEEMIKKSTPKGESLSLLGQYSFDVRA